MGEEGLERSQTGRKYIPVAKHFYMPFKKQLGETKTME